MQWKSNQKVNMMHVQDCCFAADTVGWNLVAVVVALASYRYQLFRNVQ